MIRHVVTWSDMWWKTENWKKVVAWSICDETTISGELIFLKDLHMKTSTVSFLSILLLSPPLSKTDFHFVKFFVLFEKKKI